MTYLGVCLFSHVDTSEHMTTVEEMRENVLQTMIFLVSIYNAKYKKKKKSILLSGVVFVLSEMWVGEECMFTRDVGRVKCCMLYQSYGWGWNVVCFTR